MFRKYLISFLLFFITTAALSAPQPRVALVLGSGGARGYAHVGVIKALVKAGVPIDLIAGASAGSLVGVLYADSKNPDLVEKTMLASNLNSFVDLNFLPGRGGVITGTKEQIFLSENLRARDFKDLKIKFVTVATDLATGKPVILDHGALITAVQASTALPGLVRPVHIQGLTLVDGGAAEPIPVQIAKRYHPQVIIAVDVEKTLPESLPTSALGIYNRAQDIIWRRLTVYSSTGADIIIQPKVGSVGTFALNQRAALIEIGAQATQKDLDKILKILKQKNIALIPPSKIAGVKHAPT